MDITQTAEMQVSLCRLCCGKMYPGESMYLIDTEKIKAFFLWFNAIELEFLPGFSNEFCHFCLYKIDLFLRLIWNNEKVVCGSAAQLARNTCLDRSTYGWTFCRSCLGSIRNPDASTTLEKYGVDTINILISPLGFKVNFLPDYPDYICGLCVSGLHKFINVYLINKENLTPHLEFFWRRLKKVPVPKIDVFTQNDNLPNIYNPNSSIVEVLFGKISVENLKQWLSVGVHQEEAPIYAEHMPSKATHTNPPQQPFFSPPSPPAPVSMTNQHLELLQRQANQIRVNQCLNIARNRLTSVQPNPYAPNAISPVAIQMALAQQMGGNHFINPYNMPFAAGFPHHNLLQPFAMMPPGPQAPLVPHMVPQNSPVRNIYPKRLQETNMVLEQPPEKKKRGRKSNKINASPPLQAVQEVVPQQNFVRPDQFMTEMTPWGHMAFNNTPAAPQPTRIEPAAAAPNPVIGTSAPVFHPTVLQHQMAPATHQHPAPLFQFYSSTPSAPPNSPLKQTPNVAPSPPPYPAQQPQVPQFGALPSFSTFAQTTESNSTNESLSNHKAANEAPTFAEAPQNSVISSTLIPQSELTSSPKQENISPKTTPPRDNQELRVPPIKIKFTSIIPPKTSPGQKKPSPLRNRLPVIVQRNDSPVTKNAEQEVITLYKGEQDVEVKGDLSLQTLLRHSPPVPLEANSDSSRLDNTSNFREIRATTETYVN